MCFRHDQYLYAHTAVFVGDDLVLCFLQFHCIGTRLECLQLHFLYWFKEVFLDVKLFSDESFLGFCHTTLLPLYVYQLNLEQVHQRRCRAIGRIHEALYCRHGFRNMDLCVGILPVV